MLIIYQITKLNLFDFIFRTKLTIDVKDKTNDKIISNWKGFFQCLHNDIHEGYNLSQINYSFNKNSLYMDHLGRNSFI